MDAAETRARLADLHAECMGWARRCCADDPAEAADVVQESYLAVLNGRAVFSGRSSFRTWLFGVVRMKARSARRWRWLRARRTEALAQDPTEAAPVSPDQALRDSERAATLRAALSRLPGRQQEILHLCFYHALSLAEAAEVLGLPVGTARTHYERGKARLRQWLAPYHQPIPVHGPVPESLV